MIMTLITRANSEGSGQPVHMRSLARAFCVCSHSQENYKGSFILRARDLAPKGPWMTVYVHFRTTIKSIFWCDWLFLFICLSGLEIFGSVLC